MKLTNKEMMIKALEHRIAILKTRGEQERIGLINKCKRQIRQLQREGQVE